MKATLIAATLAAGLLASALASAEAYSPDLIELDGARSLLFEGGPAVSLAGGGTLECWLAPDWTADPGYDPVLLSNLGPEGYAWAIALLRDRDGLAIVAGEEEDVVAFDFTDGQLHHVAVSQLEDGLVVIIDGRVAGTSALMLGEAADSVLVVGSLDGGANPFTGAIAGLRIWHEVVPREALARFAFEDVVAGEHPMLEALSVVSDFTAEQLRYVDTVE
ncbi:MAG: LamG-like jellyroll fold domain-containing protein [Pseudomonadales bacterium]|nr:LamG-like jellyroll fold domain-containing protein [Pseudomonadales bacterium]